MIYYNVPIFKDISYEKWIEVSCLQQYVSVVITIYEEYLNQNNVEKKRI